MTDYLLEAYEEALRAAEAERAEALRSATEIYLRATESIHATWAHATAEAGETHEEHLRARSEMFMRGPGASPQGKTFAIENHDKHVDPDFEESQLKLSEEEFIQLTSDRLPKVSKLESAGEHENV